MKASNISSCTSAGVSESLTQQGMIPMFSNYPDIVTVPQVMKMLGIGRNAVYKLLQANEIRHRRIGRRYIIPKQAVIEFINKASDANDGQAKVSLLPSQPKGVIAYDWQSSS